MTTYTLNYVDSGRVTEFFASDDTEAADIAVTRLAAGYGDDITVADQWDADGQNDDGRPCERLLIWACKDDAASDDGSRAIAQLTVVR